MHTDALVVLTTLASEEEAVTLVRELLERRIVACGTVLAGGRSLYRWQGKIEDSAEVAVLFKTRGERASRLLARLQDLHSYDVPAAVVWPVLDALPAYAAWVTAETDG